MPAINSFLSDYLTPAASALRGQSFSSDPSRSTADRYDTNAKHLLLEIDDNWLAMPGFHVGRMVFFESLIDTSVPFPIAQHVADGSRVTVSPTWRGVDLSRDYRRTVLLNFLQAKTSLITPCQASRISSDAFLLYGT